MGYSDVACLAWVLFVFLRVKILLAFLKKTGSREAVAIETEDGVLVGFVVDRIVPILERVPRYLNPQ
jgi:hypothetical protein